MGDSQSHANIPQGYKFTDVGVIPSQWELKRLDDVAQVRSGIAKNGNSTVADPVRVHYLRVANVQDGFLDLSEMSQLEISRSDLQRFSVMPGDVLMNEGGDRDKLGRGSIWRGEFQPCVHQNHVFVVRCGRAVIPEYLTLWSAGSVARKYFLLAGKQTTNLASINKSSLGELPVVLPIQDEQRAIAEALGDVDALLSSLDRLIAKKRNLKQAAMQQLLPGKTRLAGFHGEWPIKALGELFTFSGGYAASRDQLSSDGHCYLHYGDIHTTDRCFVDAKAGFQDIPKLDVSLKRVPARSMLDDGDVVFVDASEDDTGVSKHVVVVNKDRIPFIAGLHTIVAKSKTDELAHAYRRYCFQTDAVQQQFLFYAVGTKVTGISKTNIPKLRMPVPPVGEQQAIAEVLMDMDAELAALEQRRDKTRLLKQGMMQELLTGRIRLR